MNQDARNKLRNMGGIMASSPKLMQAAFQAGGPATPMPPLAPRTSGVTRPGTGAPLVGLGRVPPMMPQPITPGTAPMVPLESAPGRFVAGQGLDTAVTDSFFGEPAFSVDDLLDGLGALSSTPKTEAQQRAERIDALRRNSVEAAAEFVRSLPNPVEALSDYANIFGTEAAGVVSSAVGATETGAKFFETAEAMRSGPERRQDTLAEEDPTEALLAASEEFASSVSVPNDQPSRSAGDDTPVVSRDVNALEGPSDVEEVAAKSAAEDEPIVPPELLEDGPDREEVRNNALSSLDKSYEEKLALFKKVYNIDEEDKARDRAMNLAMIGLAVAAGQSPDFLTNVAQGTIAGLQSGEARRRGRKDKRERVKALALDAALKEQAAQQAFARELGLKTLEMGNKAQYRDSPTTRKEGIFGDVEVYLPTAAAAQKDVAPLVADPEGLDRKYKQSVEGRQKVFSKLQEAESLLNEYEIAGLGGALARARSSVGASVPSFLKDVVGLEGGAVTPQQEYDAIMRGMAAQFTPIILGESGRTISDGDRQRVAEILGFAVDRTAGTIGQYTGTAFTSKGQLQAALNEVEGILSDHYAQVDDVYSRYRPEQYTSILESTQKQAEGQSQGKRLVYDPDKGLTEK